MADFKPVQAEWRVSRVETYFVSRAYGSDDAWSATYVGPDGEVEIDTLDHEEEPVWWETCAAAMDGCRVHKLEMDRGATAEQASLYVRKCAPSDVELELAAEE